MAQVKLCALQNWIEGCLRALGMTEENVGCVSDTVMRATLRDVGHHDIYDFPGHLQAMLDGDVVINPSFRQLAACGALESWDGGNGLGELVCSFAMERAMDAARIHGIGLCAVRGSNHYLAAAPYVQRASEQGFIALLLCKGAPTMGAPNRTEKVIGTLPMGYAFPTDRGYPVLFDACMAYASFGALKEKMDRGEPVPAYWGFDSEGKPTTDPEALAKGTRLPIGSHKGFGLAVLGEALTAILSEGCVVDEPDQLHGQKSPTSHTAIAIKADALMDLTRFETRAGELLTRMQARAPGLHVPGEGAHAKKRRLMEMETIELDGALLEKLDALSARIPTASLERDG
ncbi:Ldh family oxidoreductase [Beduinella massiliensis]|uniref:Ldh family oxidoreductase n=1 Tax=Beduinella massiliensis TaxID=1852363 RepID=UPI000C84EA06